jgi:hypothetical protein
MVLPSALSNVAASAIQLRDIVDAEKKKNKQDPESG